MLAPSKSALKSNDYAKGIFVRSTIIRCAREEKKTWRGRHLDILVYMCVKT